MTTLYVIETNVPLPEDVQFPCRVGGEGMGRCFLETDLIRALEVGQSVAVPLAKYETAKTLCRRLSKRGLGFIYRKIHNDGPAHTRVWRIA